MPTLNKSKTLIVITRSRLGRLRCLPVPCCPPACCSPWTVAC
jgi:hypothetical protein